MIRLIDIEIILARRREGGQEQANRRRRRRRQIWTREWLNRRVMFGQYDTLLHELNREDPRYYKNFLRVDDGLFQEFVRRVGPQITKKKKTNQLEVNNNIYFSGKSNISNNNPWVEGSAGGLWVHEGLFSPVAKYFGTCLKIRI
jgi:hypothetical protein